MNFQLVQSSFSVSQDRFGAPPVADFRDGPIVFWTEVAAQPVASLPVINCPGNAGYNNNGHNQCDDLPGFHDFTPLENLPKNGADPVPKHTDLSKAWANSGVAAIRARRGRAYTLLDNQFR